MVKQPTPLKNDGRLVTGVGMTSLFYEMENNPNVWNHQLDMGVFRGFHSHGGYPVIFRKPPFTLWLFNIAMENPNHKWRFLAGKIIYFYGPSIFHGYVSHNQRVTIQQLFNWTLQIEGSVATNMTVCDGVNKHKNPLLKRLLNDTLQ